MNICFEMSCIPEFVRLCFRHDGMHGVLRNTRQHHNVPLQETHTQTQEAASEPGDRQRHLPADTGTTPRDSTAGVCVW